MSKYSSEFARSESSSLDLTVSEKPFSRGFFDKSNADGRNLYMKVLFGGTLSIILVIFGVLSISWASIWQLPGTLPGWVVDFDGGLIGQTVSQVLTSPEVSRMSKVTWTVISPSQFASLSDLTGALVEQKAWAAIASTSQISISSQICLNRGQSTLGPRIAFSRHTPHPTHLTTVLVPSPSMVSRRATRTHSEQFLKPADVFESLIIARLKTAQGVLDSIAQRFALQAAAQLTSTTSSTGLDALLATSPQTVLTPVSYTINNLRPFDKPM
ncbi:hypothetical protein H0H81_008035 [Sphagnurus paluster]|uniref:DUF3533 domain-containing protein n=1 Tax=Sphagnurus paluster TaxID=117069 RepID=A0A9P7FWA7_9AGAR|nr:hypothetical protein H0H81_008035 [Sphagnurus paluster]